jgi:hypothetical protein
MIDIAVLAQENLDGVDFTAEEQRDLDAYMTEGALLWEPMRGPQTLAWESEADIVFYGGAAGGGKTELIIGAALMEHEKSIIFRREAVQLLGIEERITKILGTRDGYSSQDGIWRIPKNRIAKRPTLELGSVQKVEDWRKYQGRPHDLKAFDEITHFTESQFRTLIGWMRSDDTEIKQQVIAVGNPPTDADGEWVKRFWAPWLDPEHHHPAESGELRWFISNERGEDEEMDGPAPVMRKDERTQKFRFFKPRSRTFIRSFVTDNAYYMATGYQDVLNALPEPLRSQMLRGDFTAGASDPVWQVIPTAWIKWSMSRWTDRRHEGTAGMMDILGFDVARGGLDKTSAAPRYGQWFDRIQTIPGSGTPDGPSAAAFLVKHLRHKAPTALDVVGIGSSVLDTCQALGLTIIKIFGSEGSTGSDKASGMLRFRNLRAEMYWRLREALDPTGPEPLILPPDQELLTDLAAVRYKVVTMGKQAGILMRSKDEIREILGRSPDKGDSVAMTMVDKAGILKGTDARGDAAAHKAQMQQPIGDWRAF